MFLAKLSHRGASISLDTFPTPWFPWALSASVLVVLIRLLDPSKTCSVPVCTSSLNWVLLYRDRVSQPVFVLSSGILRNCYKQMYLPGLNFLICNEYLPVLEVSGDFPGNSTFHDLSKCVLRCEDGSLSACGCLSLVWE